MAEHGVCYIIGAGEDCGLDFVPRAEDLLIAADQGYARAKPVSYTHLTLPTNQ